MASKPNIYFVCLFLAAALIFLSGCGSGPMDEYPRADVKGVVSLDGQPLHEGVIQFVPLEGTHGPKTSVEITDGKFASSETTRPVVGAHRIEIHSTDDGGYAWDDEAALERLKNSGVRRVNVVRVPPVFNKASRITKTVEADGPNEFEFQLTSRRRR